MAESVAIRRLENVTECAICTDDLNDARVLPCVHAFCLECIDKWIQKKMDGKVTCPICRKEFEVPEGGTAALRKDFFVEKMLEVKKLSTTLSQRDIDCDVCCDDEKQPGRKAAKKATVYCVDCRRSMCEQCCGYHQKFRLRGVVHKLIELNSEMSVDELLNKFPENVCEKHPEESLKIYCFDCKLAVCMMCFITTHSSHKGSDIKEVSDDLRKQMSVNSDNLNAKATKFQTVMDEIEENEREFCNSVVATETLIRERADKLRQLVEDHEKSLLDKLSDSREKQLKQTSSVCNEIERHQIVLRNFVRYSNEVREKGTSCDIAKLAEELNARAEELQKFDMSTDLSVDYNITEVNFTSPATDDEVKLSFGKLTVDFQGYFRVSGKDVHIIQNRSGQVTGMAVLNDQLYVCGTTPQIVVYCLKSCQYQRNLDLQCNCIICGRLVQTGSLSDYCHKYNCQSYRGYGVSDSYRYKGFAGMVGCGFNNCLYTSCDIAKLAEELNARAEELQKFDMSTDLSVDYNITEVNFTSPATDDVENIVRIYKVALGQNNTVSYWNVPAQPQGLSVTSSHNLLVCPYGDSLLYEYSTDGDLIRQINFNPAEISNPVHAVQLSDDHYAVIHHVPRHQFSIASSIGRVNQHDRGHGQPSDGGQLTNRTEQNSSIGSNVQQLQLVRSYTGNAGEMSGPRGIAVGERGRLFVADQCNHRVLVLDYQTLSAHPLRLPDDCKLNGPYCLHYDSASGRLFIGECTGQRVICCKI